MEWAQTGTGMTDFVTMVTLMYILHNGDITHNERRWGRNGRILVPWAEF